VISLKGGCNSENFSGLLKALHAKKLFTDDGILDKLLTLYSLLLSNGFDLLLAFNPNAALLHFLLLLK
jgi:hypothetical protein